MRRVTLGEEVCASRSIESVRPLSSACSAYLFVVGALIVVVERCGVLFFRIIDVQSMFIVIVVVFIGGERGIGGQRSGEIHFGRRG